MCMLLPVINVGKAAYYTEGLYKNVLSAFGILLTVCYEILALMLFLSFEVVCFFFFF